MYCNKIGIIIQGWALDSHRIVMKKLGIKEAIVRATKFADGLPAWVRRTGITLLYGIY